MRGEGPTFKFGGTHGDDVGRRPMSGAGDSPMRYRKRGQKITFIWVVSND